MFFNKQTAEETKMVFTFNELTHIYWSRSSDSHANDKNVSYEFLKYYKNTYTPLYIENCQ